MTLAKPDLRELARRAVEDDEGACGEIYDLLAPSVQRYLCSLGWRLNRSEVEDAVQETFLRLFRRLDRFEHDRSLTAYALGISRRVALELGRKRRPTTGETGEVPSRETPQPDRVERAERRGLIRDALSALEPEQRDALALRHANRLTMQELAESLSCSVPTARSRLKLAARRFAVELRQRGVFGAEGGVV